MSNTKILIPALKNTVKLDWKFFIFALIVIKFVELFCFCFWKDRLSFLSLTLIFVFENTIILSIDKIEIQIIKVKNGNENNN